MKPYKVALSTTAPTTKDIIWAKPVEGGFTLYLLDGGKWKPLQVVEDKSTQSTTDDLVIQFSSTYEPIVNRGTFAKKPSKPKAGDRYFCTNRQTAEGQADGIMIYYNGTTWTDALGRTVS